MTRTAFLIAIATATFALLPASAADGDPTFKSDVALARVDAQVVDRSNRAITGLHAEDFILKEAGQPREIRNFLSEDMPIDLVLLLDVSGSMRPHVERIAAAAHQALQVFGKNDRFAIMVFDRYTRVRLPFRGSREELERGLETLLRQESFNGGTDITRGLLDACQYIQKEGRRDARRAIVILTDDQTERDRDEVAVNRALRRADAVLSALIAPDAMQGLYGGTGGGRRGGRSGGSYPGSGGGGWPGTGGGGWPGTGGGLGGPLGGIILGRRGGYGGPGGGGGGSGPVIMAPHTQSAGTSEIAIKSGGDSYHVEEADALETTLARIRQRYALHFYIPDGVKQGDQDDIQVDLTAAARRRYPDAEIRFRRVNMAGGTDAGSSEPVVVRAPSRVPSDRTVSAEDTERPRLKRRPAANESDGNGAETVAVTPVSTDVASPQPEKPASVWRRVDEPSSSQPGPAATPEEPRSGGWRRVKPGEQP